MFWLLVLAALGRRAPIRCLPATIERAAIRHAGPANCSCEVTRRHAQRRCLCAFCRCWREPCSRGLLLARGPEGTFGVTSSQGLATIGDLQAILARLVGPVSSSLSPSPSPNHQPRACACPVRSIAGTPVSERSVAVPEDEAAAALVLVALSPRVWPARTRQWRLAARSQPHACARRRRRRAAGRGRTRRRVLPAPPPLDWPAVPVRQGDLPAVMSWTNALVAPLWCGGDAGSAGGCVRRARRDRRYGCLRAPRLAEVGQWAHNEPQTCRRDSGSVARAQLRTDLSHPTGGVSPHGGTSRPPAICWRHITLSLAPQ